MVNGKQIRAARVWMKWSQLDLAEKSGVSQKTIADVEGEKRIPHERTLKDLARAFEDAGMKFLTDDKGRGVGLRES